MGINLYVGNLPYSVDNEGLSQLFSEYGTVTKATVIMDRETNRSKGFGFVELEDADAGKAAIEAMDGKEVEGRPLKVNEARPREER